MTLSTSPRSSHNSRSNKVRFCRLSLTPTLTPTLKAVLALGLVVGIALTLALAPLAYAVGGDPFGGITQTINSNAKTWAGALIVLGLLGVCIRYYFGDSDASQHMRSFLWGSIAAIAAGFGLAVYDWLQRYVAVR
jgi:hypothetical protein